MQSYNNGKQWTYHAFRNMIHEMGGTTSKPFTDIWGPGAVAEKSAAFCNGLLAEANASGNVGTHPRMFSGACFDFVVTQWTSAGDTTYLEVRELMTHG